MSKAYRSAKSGEFVTKEVAAADPAGTVSETMERPHWLATVLFNGELSLMQVVGKKVQITFTLPVAAREAIEFELSRKGRDGAPS